MIMDGEMMWRSINATRTHRAPSSWHWVFHFDLGALGKLCWRSARAAPSEQLVQHLVPVYARELLDLQGLLGYRGEVFRAERVE